MGRVIKGNIFGKGKRRRRFRFGRVEAALGVFILFALGYIASSLTGSSPSPQALLATPTTSSSPVPALRMCYEGEKNTATKTCVVDGDTLWIHGTDYRLKNYDTPEPLTNICGGAAEVALAHKASARFLQLLNGNLWTLETFGMDNTGRRVLATIRIAGRDVGDVLIAEHLARRWPDGVEFWCP